MTALSRWKPFDAIRWNPFEEIAALRPRDLFGWLQPGGTIALEWSPRCEITETETEIVVQVELPGVEAKDMEVLVRESALIVRGEKREAKEETKNGNSYCERFFGRFERVIAIPAQVDAAHIEASLKDGVLEVHLPKKAQPAETETKIEIKPA